MTQTHHASRRGAPRSFFLAGVMQGARRGADLADQDYRATLRSLIQERFPDALIHDPGEVMWREMQHSRELIRDAHAALQNVGSIRREELTPPLQELVAMFHRLTQLAAESDVCVAWLPNHEPSMGTAAEMLSAWRAGSKVVAITGMRQNLAVLACSSMIVPDLDGFAAWLDQQSEPLAA
jgi:hypothetical protein